MTIKGLLIAATAGIFSISALNAQADINISNNSNIATIVVRCSGTMPTVPISKGATVTLDWGFINLIIGGLSGTCSFWNGVKHEADASIQISSDLSRAKITTFTKYDPNLQVSFSPVLGTLSADISATVTGG